MLTRPQVTPSLLAVLGLIVGVTALFGHVWAGVGAALFILALVAIDAKPSWKRVWNPPERGNRAYEGLRWLTWKRR